jgi:hypothetical protein
MTTMNLQKEGVDAAKSYTTFRVMAMPQNTADKVRSTMRSPGYGHPAEKKIAFCSPSTRSTS